MFYYYDDCDKATGFVMINTIINEGYNPDLCFNVE